MNQILFSEARKPEPAKADISQIVRAFCIIIIVFGVVLSGSGVYGCIQNNSNKIDNTIKPTPIVQKIGGTVSIVVNHNQAIKYISYRWNDGEEHTISGNGRQNMQETIDAMPGNNILTVIVVDISENEGVYSDEISYAIEGDVERPKIDMQLSRNLCKNNSNR